MGARNRASPAGERSAGGTSLDALPLHDVPLAFVDLEMTGLRPQQDRIVEICVERVLAGAGVECLTSLVRPDGPAPCFDTVSARVHGIGIDQLRDAPTFAELAPQIDSLLDGAVVVAHAARHDVAFLRAEFARAGRRWAPLAQLDTLRLSRVAFPDAPRYGLLALSEHLGLPHDQPHRAAGDVAATRALFARLVGVMEPATFGDLRRGLARDLERERAHVELAARAAEDGQPVWIAYRTSGRRLRRLPFCVTAVRTDLDPPRLFGYLHDTRGRRELVIPRIVAIERGPIP